MKLKLLKHLQEHKAKHPRQSLEGLLFSSRTVIALPYGYGYCLVFDRMWESPNLDISKLNSAGVPHKAVVAAALREAIKCVKRKEDFDFSVDIGQAFEGYQRVLRIGLDGSLKEETC
ncbi:MAG: hypothetical protein ACPL7O_10865 [Armatimonadota bacterium]